MKKFNYIAIFVVFVLAFSSRSAFASTLASQLDSSSTFSSCETTSGTGCSSLSDYNSQLVTPTVGIFDQLQFWAKTDTSSFFVVYFQDYTTSSPLVYFGPTNYAVGKTDGNGTMTLYTLQASDFSSAVNFNGTDQWYVTIFAYSTASGCSTLSCYHANDFAGDYANDFYFNVADSGGFTGGGYGGGGVGSGGGSYINPSGPLPNANTSSTTFTYSADYLYSNSSLYPLLYVPTKLEARFTRLDASEPPVSKFCTITTPNSLQTCTGSITLTSGGRYSLGWAMEDDSGDIALIHDPYQFGVVSATDLPALVPTPLDVTAPASCSTWDFTCYIEAAMSWAFVPPSDVISQFSSLSTDLSNAFPFSYFYTIRTTVESLSSADSSPISTGEFDIHSFFSAAPSGTYLPFFSGTLLQTFIPTPQADFIKGIVEFTLYIGFGFMIYRMII
jgi:hypothetical protein